MSTVSKAIADRVIAGDFPEDGIVAIVQYNNIFNGDRDYKLVFHYDHYDHYGIQWYLDGKCPSMLNCTLYWKA